MPNKLPQGWVECSLNNFADITMGQSPKSDTYNENGEGVPFFQGKAEFGIKYPKIKKWCTMPNKMADKGDILLSVRAPVGPTNICPQKACIGRGLAAIKGLGNIDNIFIRYLLNNFEFKMHLVATGTTFKAISSENLKKILLPLPPLNEQRRIVEKIESEFAKIDEGLERLEKAKEQIKQYRQSVLKSAFEGKLYKTSEWTKKNIGEITSKIIGGGTPSKNITQYYEGEIPFMTVKDMTSSRPIDTEWHITKEAVENSSTNIIPKDTIIIATRVGLGKIVRVNFATTINQDLKALILKECIDKDFCEYLIIYKTPEIIAKGRGTTVKGITLEELKDIKFNLPSLNEQKKIVEEIKKRFAVANEVEKAVEDNIEKAKQLKQSILKKAFEGRLVPQDPNDEPATKLLEKIKQERKENDRK